MSNSAVNLDDVVDRDTNWCLHVGNWNLMLYNCVILGGRRWRNLQKSLYLLRSGACWMKLSITSLLMLLGIIYEVFNLPLTFVQN